MKKISSSKGTAKRILAESLIGKVKYQSLFERMFRYALKGMNYGGGSLPSDSGEIYVLEHVRNQYKDSSTPLTIFDVGANVGDYTALILNTFKGLTLKIHSFEPSKQTFETLKKAVGHEKNVSLHNFGCGKETATVPLYSDEPNSGLASIHNRRLNHFDITLTSTESIDIKKIDDVRAEENISRIHFLKLDIEGNELAALEGARRMISEGRIDNIQFEFGGSNIDSRTYFQDFFYLLNPTHRIYRIVKDGLYPIDKYRETQEIFITTNYLAKRRNQE